MENIKQLKNEVNDIMDKLKKISSKLDNVEEKKEEFNFNKIYLIGKKYAFKWHPLSKHDDYTKFLYFTFLSVIIQYKSNITENKLLFLSRLNEGCNTKLNLKDIIKSGITIKDNLFEEFVYVVKSCKLQYNFIVDALIFIGISNEKSAVEFLAQLTEVLELQKEELDFLTKLSINVLEQNNQKYGNIIKEIPNSIDIACFFFYIKKYVEGCIIKSKKNLWYFSKNMSKFRFNIESISINSENVVFQNFIFDLSNVSLRFLQGKNITFENCEFIGGANPIEIQDYKTLNIYNCTYKYFNNRTFYIKNIENIILKSSIFDSCSLTEEYAFGGVIYAKTCEKIEVKNSRFKNCKIFKEDNSKTDGCVFYCEKSKTISLLNNSIFEECNNYKKYGGIYKMIELLKMEHNKMEHDKMVEEKNGYTLFGVNSNVKHTNCKFLKCDKIN